MKYDIMSHMIGGTPFCCDWCNKPSPYEVCSKCQSKGLKPKDKSKMFDFLKPKK